MGQHSKPTKLVSYWGPIEITVRKVKIVEMVKQEEGVVGGDRANKAAVTKIKANHIPCFVIRLSPIPQTLKNIYNYTRWIKAFNGANHPKTASDMWSNQRFCKTGKFRF